MSGEENVNAPAAVYPTGCLFSVYLMLHIETTWVRATSMSEAYAKKLTRRSSAYLCSFTLILGSIPRVMLRGCSRLLRGGILYKQMLLKRKRRKNDRREAQRPDRIRRKVSFSFTAQAARMSVPFTTRIFIEQFRKARGSRIKWLTQWYDGAGVDSASFSCFSGKR